MASKFQSTLPDGFFKPLSKEITTIGKTNEKLAKAQSMPLDTEIILKNVLVLLNREVVLENVFHYELVPMPTSLLKSFFNILKVEHQSLPNNMFYH